MGIASPLPLTRVFFLTYPVLPLSPLFLSLSSLSSLSLFLSLSSLSSLSLSFSLSLSLSLFHTYVSSSSTTSPLRAEIYKRERAFQGRTTGSSSNGNNLENKDAPARKPRGKRKEEPSNRGKNCSTRLCLPPAD